jgi:hypothetical protein
MAKEAKVNYTAEMTAAIVDRYKAGETVEAIAASISKAVRSVRSKLVREGVYTAAEKPKGAKREEGPTKKELLRELETLAPNLPIDGFVNATKEAITALIQHLESAEADDESDDEPAQVDESGDAAE